MKVNMEGFKAMLGVKNENKVETPLFDTIEQPENFEPKIEEAETRIGEVALEKVLIYQQKLLGIDTTGRLWLHIDDETGWKRFGNPTVKYKPQDYSGLLRKPS